MKLSLHLSCTFILVIFSASSEAIVAVQRTVNSDIKQFQSYLKKIHGQDFATAYIQLSEKMDPPTVQLETCLEETYLGRSGDEPCFAAVKSLTVRPLNSLGRDILFSLLARIEKNQSPRRDFFHQLKLGLSIPKAGGQETSNFSKLEVKAWKKALSKKLPFEEVHVLVNGFLISNLENWKPPTGVFQWALISNTYEPFIRLSTFNQFAADSVKDLSPIAENCKTLKNYEIKKYGLLRTEIFASDACIAQEHFEKSLSADHLTPLPEKPTLSADKRGWLWPIVTAVGLGLAVGLKGKNVQVSMPSFR